MAVRPDRLYIGGDLSMIGGVFLTSFAQFDGLTAVELRSFTAEGYKDRVSLNWETGSEMHNAGFHLWRSRNEQGKYIKITRNFIPSEGETSLGAAYNHEDEKVQLGKTYYYRLKSFAEDGASVSYGPVSATVGGDLARLPRKWSHRFSWWFSHFSVAWPRLQSLSTPVFLQFGFHIQGYFHSQSTERQRWFPEVALDNRRVIQPNVERMEPAPTSEQGKEATLLACFRGKQGRTKH